MSQVKAAAASSVTAAWMSMEPGPIDARSSSAPACEPRTSMAIPNPSSEATSRVSTTKAIDHPIAFANEIRPASGAVVNGCRGVGCRGRG